MHDEGCNGAVGTVLAIEVKERTGVLRMPIELVPRTLKRVSMQLRISLFLSYIIKNQHSWTRSLHNSSSSSFEEVFSQSHSSSLFLNYISKNHYSSTRSLLNSFSSSLEGVFSQSHSTSLFLSYISKNHYSSTRSLHNSCSSSLEEVFF